jgi:hypothetical protein
MVKLIWDTMAPNQVEELDPILALLKTIVRYVYGLIFS